MSKNFEIERLSDRLPNLLPDFVKDEAPIFEQFLKSYFEFLEAEILTLSSQGDLEGILLEDNNGDILLEEGTVKPAPDSDSSYLLNYQNTTPFEKGQYIVGSKTGSVAEILTINGNNFYIKTIEGNGFDKGETVTARMNEPIGSVTQTGNSGVVEKHKHNTVLANNQLLNYSDIDNTTEEFLDYFQKDFIPSLDIDETKDARLTIKNINDLYQKKGTAESLQFLLRLLYGQDAEISYPIENTIHASESAYDDQRRIAIKMDNVNEKPEGTDKVIQYQDDEVSILAEAIVENVYTIDATTGEYSLEITNNHFGTFDVERACQFVDRDGVTTVNAVVKGILSDYTDTESSIYAGMEDGSVLLLESTELTGIITTDGTTNLVGGLTKFLSELKVGDSISYKVGNDTYTDTIATIVDDTTATLTANSSGLASGVKAYNNSTNGGIVIDEQSFGSMYSLNDKLEFIGGKGDRDTLTAQANIDGLRKGGVTKVFVEAGGTGYNGGDIVVFDNSNADGNAAEAVIGAIEDVAILENATEYGHFELFAIPGQTIFRGVDNNGFRVLFNDNEVKVFKDGVLQTPYTDYTFKNDRVTFTNAMSGNEIIEIFTKFNNLLLEDGDRVQLNTTESHIRRVYITSPGTGYTQLPRAFPGGYIYMDDLSGFGIGEVVRGGTSNATASIIRKETKDGKNRLVVKRESTDTGQFQSSESIVGLTSGITRAASLIKVSSGTGAKLVAYSDEIGGVGSINIQDQGYKFNEDPVIGGATFYKMLITTPSATLTQDLTFTGRITGTTARVELYDPNRQILTFKEMDGCFLDNEEILYNNTDTFKILKFNPYTGRGKLGGEGIIQKQLLTDKGTIDSSAINIHDSKIYQSHSYIIKIGESINKYRSIVKDLVHPSGHIFFGEVAVKEFVNPFDEITNAAGVERESRFNFLPTIIMQGFPTYHFDLELADSVTRDDESNILLENGYHLILEDSPDVNAITNMLTQVQIYTKQAELNSPLVVYMPTDETTIGNTHPTAEDFKQRHVNLFMIKSLANAKVLIPERIETNPIRAVREITASGGKFYWNGEKQPTLVLQRGITYDFSHPSIHPVRFSTTPDGTHGGGSQYTTGISNSSTLSLEALFDENTPDTLYYYCGNHANMGGEVKVVTGNRFTSLNLDTQNNPYHSPYEIKYERRHADLGIVMTSFQLEDENMVFEDGGLMQLESEHSHFRMEAPEGDGLGGTFIFEDGDYMELEDASYMSEPLGVLKSERVANYNTSSLRTEDDMQITLEDGGVMLDESTQGTSITSYAPMNYTIGDINKLSNQEIYNISYYLLDEDVSNDADEDQIVLEDGYGSILLEESDPSGLTFNHLQNFLPSLRMKNFDNQSNKRTHIAHSSYVKSSKITNSTLSSL